MGFTDDEYNEYDEYDERHDCATDMIATGGPCAESLDAIAATTTLSILLR